MTKVLKSIRRLLLNSRSKSTYPTEKFNQEKLKAIEHLNQLIDSLESHEF